MRVHFLYAHTLCLCALALLAAAAADLARARVFTDRTPKIVSVDGTTGQFLDSYGRSRFFHGTNVVTKSPPYYPPYGDAMVCDHSMGNTLCDEDMDYLAALGVNSLRLGVMWAGAEPERGVYNATYFDAIHDIVQRLESRGIYTLVDVHQDVLAKQFCQEGVPDWFVQTDWIADPAHRFPVPQKPTPFTVNAAGMPDPISQCWEVGADWFVSYFTYAVSDAFQRLYDNYDGLGDAFSDYWAKVALEFRNYSSIMGYDLLNEPWAGNVWADPTLLVPGVAAKKNFAELWENCTAKIRAVDETTVVFFESVTWDVVDGHDKVPGGDGSRTGLSYHYYAPPQLGLQVMYHNRVADARRLGTGGMLTEFRMWAGGPAVMREMLATVDMADEHLQSWMGWAYSTERDTSLEIEKHYGRTYATGVAGRVVAMSFSEITAVFVLTWTANTSISEAPTEVKLNRRLYYPNGIKVEVSPEEALSWERVDDQNLHFWYTQNAVDGQNVTVRIGIGWEDEECSPTSEECGNGNARVAHSANPIVAGLVLLSTKLVF